MSDHRPFDRPWASRIPSGGPRADRAVTDDRAAGPVAQGAPPAGPSSPPGRTPTRPPSDSRASSAARDLAEGLRAMSGDDAPVEEEGAESAEASVPGADPMVADPPEPAPASDSNAAATAAAASDEADVDSTSDDGVAEAEAAISSDLKALSRERDEYLEALKRLQADFENYKKRMMRQQTATLERAAEDLVNKLLPVLDTIDLARRHGGGEAVEQVATALLDVLGKEGLEPIAPAGKPFDPTEHEAVAHQEGDGEPEVVDVMRVGYRWRGRLLRPAMVSVKG